MATIKKVHRAGVYADFFCDGVQRGSLLTLAGQVGVDENGDIAPDMKGQVVVCYQNIQLVLQKFGATMDDIVDETWFVTDIDECMENVVDIFAERERFYDRKPEVSQTLVGVSALVNPDLKVEIKCVAHLG